MRRSSLVLFVCAGLLLSGGIILGVSTAWNLFRMSYYFWTTDLGVELSCGALFIAGALLCLPTCRLTTLVPYYPKSSCLLVLMVLITGSMVLLSTGLSSTMALSKAIRDPAMLKATMLRAISDNADGSAVRNAFDSMQIELKCCGVNSYTDWNHQRHDLPTSCCGRVRSIKLHDRCEYPMYNEGCFRPALAELRLYANSLSVLSCAIIFVMAVTLCTTAYTLVTEVVERSLLKNLPIRIACVGNTAPLNTNYNTATLGLANTHEVPQVNSPARPLYPSLVSHSNPIPSAITAM